MKLTWTNLFINTDRCAIGMSDNTSATIQWIPIEESDTTQNQESNAPSQSTPAAHIAAARIAASDVGATTGPLVVSIPSTWCLAATVLTDGLLRRQRRQGLLYRLEEKLPIDIERCTADYVEAGDQAFAVATLNHEILPWLQAIDEAGLSVAHLCPTPLLIAQALMHEPAATQSINPNGVLLSHHEANAIDVVGWHDETFTSWQHHPIQLDTGTLELDLTKMLSSDIGNDEPREVARYYINSDPKFTETIQTCVHSAPPESQTGHQREVEQAFATATLHSHKLILQGKPPMIDLARDQLAGRGLAARLSKPMQLAAAAVTLLLLTVGIASHWRANQTARLLETQEAQITALYRDTFPGQSVPSAIVSRLRSEASKAKGLAGSGEGIPAAGSTLKDLESILTGLPTDLRLRILEIRLESTRLYLDGQARSHADAERIATSLRSTLDFTLQPPRTQNLAPPGRQGNNAVGRESGGGVSGGGGGGGASGGGVAWVLTGERDRGTR